MRPKQVLTLWVRVDLKVIAMKEYSILPKALQLKSHHWMQFSLMPGHLEFFLEESYLNAGDMQCDRKITLYLKLFIIYFLTVIFKWILFYF